MKKPPILLSEKLTAVTPKKNHAKILIVAEIISHYLKDTLEETFRDMVSFVFFRSFTGSNGQIKST